MMPNPNPKLARSVFYRYDADGSGSLEREELEAVCMTAPKLFEGMHTDQNGNVSLDGWLNFINGLQQRLGAKAATFLVHRMEQALGAMDQSRSLKALLIKNRAQLDGIHAELAEHQAAALEDAKESALSQAEVQKWKAKVAQVERDSKALEDQMAQLSHELEGYSKKAAQEELIDAKAKGADAKAKGELIVHMRKTLEDAGERHKQDVDALTTALEKVESQQALAEEER